MARLDSSKVYCTDEDLLVAAPGDFAELVPENQAWARGTDGVLSGGSWTLTSAVPFATQLVRAGMVCRLTRPTAAFKTPDLLIVQAVANGSLTLRRVQSASGEGQPPGPAAGVSAVEFAVLSLWPQIERASFDVNLALEIDEAVPGRTFADLYDPREAQPLCVALVLYRQYLDMARDAGKDRDFARKSYLRKQEYDLAVARLNVHLKNNRDGASRVNRQSRVVR